MREKCPVCGSKNRFDDWSMQFLIPDNWSLPRENKICLCLNCGMIYYDNENSQENYDKYYVERYGWDGTLYNGGNQNRLNELAELAAETVEGNLFARIMDFGGGDGYLIKQLKKMGFVDTFICNIGDKIPLEKFDLIIASEVFEHLYDLRKILKSLIRGLKPEGLFLVEIPTVIEMNTVEGWPIWDFHQKHINHFGPMQLDLLFFNFGFFPLKRGENRFETYNTPQYRAVYGRNIMKKIYKELHHEMSINIDQRVEKLSKISKPVIVWGCGDYCLHMLTKVQLNVAYFVDLDPAFRGEKINGIPVLDHVESNDPIVIMAQGQKTSILKSIKDAGLKNEVIEI